MKYLNKLLFLCIILVISSINLMSQVSVNGTNYTTLKAGFDAINAGSYSGDIVVKITGNTTESASAVLLSSGNGQASYSSVVIYPTGNYTIQGNVTPSLIELRGTKYVTIDGRVNQSGSSIGLTLQNNSTSTAAVVWIDSSATDGPATYNKLSYCKVVGGSISSTYNVVLGGSASVTTAGQGVNYNEISNNLLLKGYIGVRIYGLSTGMCNYNKIYGNTFGSTTNGDEISYQPLYIYYTQYTEIYDNLFESLRRTSTVYTMYLYYSTYMKVYNNTMQNANISSSFYYIYAVSSGSSEFYNNTSKNNSATSSFYHIYLSSSGSSKVYDNVIENNTSSGGVNYAIYLSSSTSTEIYDNVVKNHYGSSTVYGTYLTSSGSSKVNNNSYTNLTSAISSLSVIYFNSSTSCEAIGNTAKGMSASTTGYGIYFASSGYGIAKNNKMESFEVLNGTAYIVYLSSSGSSEISYNTFKTFKSTGINYGIYNVTGTDCKIQGNLISDVNSNGTGAVGAYGIYIASGNSQIIVNNAISYIRTTNYSSSSLTNNPFGIALAGGTGHKVYFNTVYLSGTQNNVGITPSLSSAFLVSSTSVNGIDVRNNVFANSLSGVSGSKSYAVYLTGSSNMTNSSVINYNDYYAPGSQSIFGYFAGDILDLTSWKSSTSQDQNSFSINPLFNSALFPSPAPGSQIVNLGTSISGYDTDMLGKTRNSSNPTPGAFEEAEDIVGPDILFDKLTSTTSTQNRSVVATITDFSGISTTNAPRLYYRKSTNSNTYLGNTSSTDGWKFVTPTINGSQYNFTIDYSKLYGGIQAGDRIEYFVIAQDNSENNNLSVNDGEFGTLPLSTVLTAQDFPFVSNNAYDIAYSMSGSYYVGLNQEFNSLTSDGGFFQFANKAVLTGNVTVYITSNTMESGAFQLGKMPEEFGNGWSITIKPLSTQQVLLTGSIAGALFRIIGTNNLTIDGSAGVADGKYLEFNNASTTGTRVTFMIGSGGSAIDGGKNITLTNIKITGAAPTTSSAIGLLLSDASVSTAGSSGGVNNFTLKNSEIFRVMYGTITRGTSAAPLQNLLIENNIYGSNNSNDYIYQYFMDVQYAPNGMVRGNKLYNSIHDAGSNKYAIQLGGVQSPGINVIGNWIHSLKYNGTGGWGCYGVNLIGGDNHVIMNNMISDISTDRYSATSTSYNPFAIRITSGSGHKIWHNTVNMYGMQGGTNTTASLMAVICITSSATNNLDIRGNIFNNTLEGLANSKSFIYYNSTTHSGKFSIVERNLINWGSNQGAIAGWGTTSPFNPSADLTAWQTTFGYDYNSVKGTASFISNYDLHLTGNLLGNSTYNVLRSVDVLKDKDGEDRNLQTFYGADEMNPIFAVTSNTSASPDQSVYCYGSDVELSFTAGITGYGDGIARSGAPTIGYAWFKNGEYMNVQPYNYTVLYGLTKNDSADYYAKAYFMDKELTSNTFHVKTEGPMSITQNISDAEVCNDNPVLEIHTEADGTFTGYQWEKYNPNQSAWLDIDGATQPSLNIPLANPEEAIGTYRARIMGPGNCGPATLYTNESFVNVTVPITNEYIKVDFNPKAICKGDRIEFFGHAEGTIFGYQWQYSAGGSFVDLPIEEFPTAKSNHLIIDNALPEMSGKYRMVVYGSYACGDEFVTTNEIDIYVFPTFEIEDQPTEQAACVGETVNLGIYANGQITGYQWYKNDVPISLEENPNAQNQFIQFKNVTFETSGNYYCLLSYEDCSGAKTLKSHIAPIYVAISTEITHKPETQAAALGGDAYFTFKAHVNGLPNTYDIPVQWYRGDVPLVDDGRIQGARAQILHISNVQESDYREDYKLVLKGLCGTTEVVDFGIVKVDINITGQPTSVNQCEGTMAVFNVTANSTIGLDQITYLWFKDGVAIYDGARISGANTNKLVISNINEEDAGDYYVKVGLKGASNTATSLPATMTVNPLPKFSLNLDPEFTAKEDDLVEFFVATTGSENTYQWYFNGIKIDGADEDVFIIDEVKPEDAGDYYVIATNDCGTTKSNVLKLTVTPKNTTSTEDMVTFIKSINKPTPHPVTSISEVQFTMNINAETEISLFDINGKKLAVLFNGIANVGNNTIKIDANKLNLNSGTYLLVLTSNNQTVSETITIIK